MTLQEMTTEVEAKSKLFEGRRPLESQEEFRQAMMDHLDFEAACVKLNFMAMGFSEKTANEEAEFFKRRKDHYLFLADKMWADHQRKQ